jgi:hypothetical protein
MIGFADPALVALDDLHAEAERAGACDLVIGGRTKGRAVERFAATLHFPEWAGRNLDALDELLDEHAHRATDAGRDWTLIWVPSPRLVAEHPRDYARLVAVLADVASRRPGPTGTRRGVRRVLVHGPAPTPPSSMEPA